MTLTSTSAPALAVHHKTRLLELQRQSFGYFTHELNAAKGLVLDKSAVGWPASIAAMGMALTAWIVGAERGYLTRAEAIAHTLAMLRFLMASEQSDSPGASGYRGFYYHFLDATTGVRTWGSELSSIDTALLMAGVLAARAYYLEDADDERELRSLCTALYDRVDWRWMQAGGPAICHGWTPEAGFLPWHWLGYDEALILYVLALGSPTHPVGSDAYTAWAATYEWKTVEGIECLHCGPLFTHQMSHVWIDFRGIRDAYMRDRSIDYFENSRRATQAQRLYAIRNPQGCAMYGENVWGLTASDGPGELQLGGRIYHDYIARGIPDGPDDGTVAPWVVVASLPFAPEIVLPAIDHLHSLRLHVDNPYGFQASFNATVPKKNRRGGVGWVSPFHFGINEGPTVMMIENFLTGLVWRVMRECPAVRGGLRRAGFEGGWLVG